MRPQTSTAASKHSHICRPCVLRGALLSRSAKDALLSWARAYDGPARHFAHRITSERSGMRAGGSRYRDPLLCATLFPSHHSSLIFFSRRLNLTHLDVLSKVRAPPKSSPPNIAICARPPVTGAWLILRLHCSRSPPNWSRRSSSSLHFLATLA
jgi:hypothetical protein